MKIYCSWVCPYNKNGECSEPRDLILDLSRNGYFTCNKLSEIISKSYDLKETQ